MTQTVVKWEQPRVSLSVGPGFLLLETHNKKFCPREDHNNNFCERTSQVDPGGVWVFRFFLKSWESLRIVVTGHDGSQKHEI